MNRMLTMLTMLMGVGCNAKQADTGNEARVVSKTLVMASETSSGRILIADGARGVLTGELCLNEIFPESCSRAASDLARPCLMFGFELHHGDETDSVLFTATLRDPDLPYAPSAIALVNATHPSTIQWTIRSLTIPSEMQQGFDCVSQPESALCNLYGAHTVSMQEDGTLLVTDTSNSRILWLDQPENGTDTAHVKHILSSEHPEWGSERFPNMVQPISVDGAEHLLITHKGNSEPGTSNKGSIVLWNVHDRSNPRRVWSYPDTGHLAAVHSGQVFETPQGSLLLYAHSLGAAHDESDDREGTVGFASFNGVTKPTYLADGRLPDPGLGFTREVEWVEEWQRLMITDSGCEHAQDDCGRQGRVLLTELPELSASTLSGSADSSGAHQTYIDLKWTRSAFDAALKIPFDADRVGINSAGLVLRSGIGSCSKP